MSHDGWTIFTISCTFLGHVIQERYSQSPVRSWATYCGFLWFAYWPFQTIFLKDVYCNLIGNVPWQPQGTSRPFYLGFVLQFDRKCALAASGQFQTIFFKDVYCNLIGNVPWQPQGNSRPFSLRNGINFDRKWSLAASAGALVLESRLPARNQDQRF